MQKNLNFGTFSSIIMKTVIGFVGLPGAGKSTAIEVARKYAPVVVMGDVIRDETRNLNLPITSQNLGKIAIKLRKDFGKDVVAQRCAEKMQQMDADIVILDGIRSLAEVDIIKSKFEVKIIAIIVPDSKRHQWLLERKRDDDSADIQDILKRDEREIQFGVKKVIDGADFQIENNQTKEDLQMKCHQILQELISHD